MTRDLSDDELNAILSDDEPEELTPEQVVARATGH